MNLYIQYIKLSILSIVEGGFACTIRWMSLQSVPMLQASVAIKRRIFPLCMSSVTRSFTFNITINVTLHTVRNLSEPNILIFTLKSMKKPQTVYHIHDYTLTGYIVRADSNHNQPPSAVALPLSYIL
jgi:hypothetical protein